MFVPAYSQGSSVAAFATDTNPSYGGHCRAPESAMSSTTRQSTLENPDVHAVATMRHVSHSYTNSGGVPSKGGYYRKGSAVDMMILFGPRYLQSRQTIEAPASCVTARRDF